MEDLPVTGYRFEDRGPGGREIDHVHLETAVEGNRHQGQVAGGFDRQIDVRLAVPDLAGGQGAEQDHLPQLGILLGEALREPPCFFAGDAQPRLAQTLTLRAAGFPAAHTLGDAAKEAFPLRIHCFGSPA